MKKITGVLIFTILVNGLIICSTAFGKNAADDIGDEFRPPSSTNMIHRVEGNHYQEYTCANPWSFFKNEYFLILVFGFFILSIYQFTKGYKLRGFISLVLVFLIFIILVQVYIKRGYQGRMKPVIYFYSPKEQVVNVRLTYAGNLTVTYPRYDTTLGGWRIKAYPDGRIVNLADEQEYSYIFWEGTDSGIDYDLSKGFVVEGEKTDEFLRETLKKMGLIPREYNEFIVYWYPLLKENKYNLIFFVHEEYEKMAKLEINPKPDSMLRIFMVYKPLDKKIDIPPQEIKPFTRGSGFTVVEWGGGRL